MNIIFVVDSFPSISETFILNQITGLIDQGHHVLIFSAARSAESNFHDDIRKYDLLKKTYYHHERPHNKFKRVLWALFMIFAYGHRNPLAIVRSLNFFKYGKEALSLNHLFQVLLFLGVEKADIIFCHFGPNGNFGALMKELGIAGKLVCMFHGYDIRRGIGHPGMYAPLFKHASAILSISQYNRRHLIEFGAPLEKIHDHPVGINLKRYDSIHRNGLTEGKPIKILTVGRLIPEKSILDGIEVVRILVKERGLSSLEYHIVGDGPMRDELEARVKELGLNNHVFLRGYQVQAGVIQMLSEAHIFFLPSVAEALPLVLMEASAARLPVVTTQVGSVDEIVLDGVTGFCVPVKDTQVMSDKIEYLIRHPQVCKDMGIAGSNHIHEHFNVEHLNQKLIGLFQRLHKVH